MPLCVIFRGLFSYTKITCQLKCSLLVHKLKDLKEYICQVINVVSILHTDTIKH